MALTRQHIIDAALEILGSYGLADLSMRRLARELDVQPGALYWHVKNKQELLGAVAQQILAAVPVPEPSAPALEAVRECALSIRAALLSVRDGAEVVALAQALDPAALEPMRRMGSLLTGHMPLAEQGRWGSRILTHYILGAVAEEQTQEYLSSAGLLPPGPLDEPAEAAFIFGVETILRGLQPCS